MPKHRHIDGGEATRLAYDDAHRVLVRLPSEATDGQALGERALSTEKFANKKAPPPRLRKPDKRIDTVVAPTLDLQEHNAALRVVFGETLSDEFVDVMLTQLIKMLAPGPFDILEEATLNAAIAVIASIGPQSELEALLAVQVAARHPRIECLTTVKEEQQPAYRVLDHREGRTALLWHWELSLNLGDRRGQAAAG